MNNDQLERYRQFIDLILHYNDSFINILAPHLKEATINEFINSFTPEHNQTMQWIQDNVVKSLELDRDIVTFVNDKQKVTNADVEHQFKIHHKTARTHLQKLVKEGLIGSFQDKKTFYVSLQLQEPVNS